MCVHCMSIYSADFMSDFKKYSGRGMYEIHSCYSHTFLKFKSSCPIAMYSYRIAHNFDEEDFTVVILPTHAYVD